jgi:hypothetical protein
MSSSEAEVLAKDLKSDKVGVDSVDGFVDSLNGVVDTLDGIQTGIAKRKYKLAKSLDFKKAAPIKNIIGGMILQYYGAANDISNLKVGFKLESLDPTEWFEMSLAGISIDNAQKQIEGVKDYLQNLFENMTVKLPDLATQAQGLVEQASGLQESAQGEFDALDAFAKVTALGKTAKVISTAPKVASAIKDVLEFLKKEFEELKAMAEVICFIFIFLFFASGVE